MFWGCLFLAIGVLIILQQVLRIDLPIIKILFGLFLVYLGLRVIFGSFGMRFAGSSVERISTPTEAVFTDSSFRARGDDGKLNREFSTAFGSSSLDLSELKTEELTQVFKVQSAFGSTQVKTNTAHQIRAKISTGFGSVVVRGQRTGAFGEVDYLSPGFTEGQPTLNLEIDCAFGQIEVL